MALAKEKGWGVKPDEVSFGDKIALLHEEVSEALKAYRKGNMNDSGGVAEELADLVIRAVHLAGIYSVDLDEEIRNKLNRNKSRDWGWDKL